MQSRCDHCRGPIPADAREDARFCRASHRVAWHKAREKRDLVESRELLRRWCAAERSGDAEALALVHADATAFLKARGGSVA
jgi:hypothetical protein